MASRVHQIALVVVCAQATDNEGAHPGAHPTQYAPSHNPQPQAGSRRSHEANILLTLADLEASIQDLANDTNPHLDALSLPSAKKLPTAFPLSDLITRSSDLRSDLDNITYKAPSVTLSKEAISKKLDVLNKRLTSARKKWLQALSAVREEQTPTHENIFDSSACLLMLFSHTDIQTFFSPPLQLHSRKC